MSNKTTSPQEILKKARESAGMRQEDVAKEIRVSHRMYQRYEAGEFPKYKSESILKLDNLLGTNLYDTIYATKQPEEVIIDKNEGGVSTQQTITLDASVILELLNESRKEKAAMIEVINKNLTQLQKSSNYTNSGIDDVKLLLKDIVIRQLDALLSKPETLNPEEVQVQLSEQKGSGNVRGGKKFRKKEMGSTH